MTEKKDKEPEIYGPLPKRADMRFLHGYTGGSDKFPYISVFELPPKMDLHEHLKPKGDLDKKKE